MERSSLDVWVGIFVVGGMAALLIHVRKGLAFLQNLKEGAPDAEWSDSEAIMMPKGP
jgi:hypothetical protein